MPSDLTWRSAHDLAGMIARGEVSSREVCTAFCERIAAVNPSLNAVVTLRLERALAEADEADRAVATGKPLGPLHGVPITVKEHFYLADTPACMGLERLRNELSSRDGVHVSRLRTAGAIILGKTNVPQLMLWHECDNPVFGRTNNPWNRARTPGGSTGGEGAILAARGSPLGLGSDLGGSIRIPAHYCGVHGFKPTLGLLPRGGARGNFLGLEAIQAQVGPLARHVDDLALALELLSGPDQPIGARGGLPVAFSRSSPREVRGMRIGYWTDDGGLPVSPAITRAVEEAAAALRSAGAIVEKNTFSRGDEVLELFVTLVQADGGANLRRIAAGSPLDWRVSRILTLAGLWRPLRWGLVAGLKLSGQQRLARIASAGRTRSADSYWRLVTARDALECQLLERMQTERYDAWLTPGHGLPAPQHGKPIDLLSAASTTLLPNVLGWPAGVVSLTRVREGEESNRSASRDKVERQAQAVELGSAGLPVGVQVISSRFRDAEVLSVMKALEQAFRDRADYPGKADLPATPGPAKAANSG